MGFGRPGLAADERPRHRRPSRHRLRGRPGARADRRRPAGGGPELLGGFRDLHRNGHGSVIVQLPGGEAALPGIVRTLDGRAARRDPGVHQPSLDDGFLNKTGRKLEGAGKGTADDAASDQPDLDTAGRRARRPAHASAFRSIPLTVVMRVLTTANLRSQAAEVIRASILGGELEPGEIYSAPALAERLGVSATPVREAMLDLARDGLIEPVRNRGFRVVVVDDAALDEISEVRHLLEVPAMALVVERAPDGALASLEADVEAIERAAAVPDVPEFLLADRRFHLGLLRLTGNGRLVALVAQLRNQTRLIGIKRLAESGQLMASALEHRPILDAARRRDAAGAQGLMREHLDHTRETWAGRAPAPAGPPAGGR